MLPFVVRCGLILAPIALIACSGISAAWIKPGASEAQVRADNAACRQEAEDVYGLTANITRDIEVSRPPSLVDTERESDTLRDYDTQQNYDKVFNACMAGRGYTKREDAE